MERDAESLAAGGSSTTIASGFGRTSPPSAGAAISLAGLGASARSFSSTSRGSSVWGDTMRSLSEGEAVLAPDDHSDSLPSPGESVSPLRGRHEAPSTAVCVSIFISSLGSST